MTNSLVTSISLSCPQLQVIELDPDDPVDYSVLPMLIANCKQVEIVEVRSARLSFHTAASGEMFCNIRGINPNMRAAKDSIDLLTALTLPIHEYRWEELDDYEEHALTELKYLPVNRQALYLLVKHGSILEDIRIDLLDDVEPEDLQHLLVNCPNLTVLKLHAVDDTATLVDETIRRLPSQCPKLVDLELNCCAPDASTQAVIDMLSGYRFNDMISLAFSGYLSLTDEIFDAMDDHFPMLRQVATGITPATKERALEFIIKRRFSPLRRFGSFDVNVEWIKRQLEARGVRIPLLKFVS